MYGHLRIGIYLLHALSCVSASPSFNSQPLDIRLFHSLNRIGPPIVSPDATKVLFTQARYIHDDNNSETFINVVDLAGEIEQLTPAKGGETYGNPLWFDKETIGFLHKNKLYRRGLDEANTTTVYSPVIDISSVSYRSGRLVFVASVYPNATLVQTKDLAAVKKRDSALIYDNLWVRHWDEWMSLRKPTLFSVKLEDWKVVGKETNLLQNLPVFHDPLLRWSLDEHTVDRQGRNAAFTVRTPEDGQSWTTNVGVYTVPVDGTDKPRLLSSGIEGISSAPAFSADGRWLAWLQIKELAYESGQKRIYVGDLVSGKVAAVAHDWDRSPQSLVWSQDGTSLYAVVADSGNNNVYVVDVESGRRKPLTDTGSASAVRLLGKDLVLLHSNTDSPVDIHRLNVSSGERHALTAVNRKALKNVYMGSAEDFSFTGARGDQVHGWLVKPPSFDPSKQYPLACLIHGGPQQCNTHSFGHSQWNPNVYASAGFIAVQINFHGSSSYGQNFTDSIQQQWGGYPYEDLMKGLDYLLSEHGFIDGSRMVALGASYGGYMVNWINAQTTRFRALVSHDGMFSVPSFWYSTEELWFPEHDFGGVPFDPDVRPHYELFNPERCAANFSTPTLFIHGANDFRLTADQSLAPFTLLRRKGIPARLMFFPDENHWTSRTANSVRWYTEVLRWISAFTNTTLPYALD
ncbi:dipeptidylpeptidase [Coemansia sp. S146]|nr:dipeptidylpeptidase [Coemansia sp. S146]